MPFIKISGLTTATAVSATNQFEINQNGASRSATIGQIETFINPVKPGSIGSSGLTMNTGRLLGRTTASAGAIEEISVGSGLTLSAGTLSASLSTGGRLLNVQVFTSSGTYTRTSGATQVVVIAVGGGGGGGGLGGAGGNGGTTSFGAHVSAAGGSGAAGGNATTAGGAGGTGGSGALIAIPGQGGGAGSVYSGGGLGGGQGGARTLTVGNNGADGSRGGGGSGGSFLDNCAGYAQGNGGGGQGETAIDYITSVGATETVTIGAGGSGGASGGIRSGGAGGAGYVIVYEYS